MRAINTSDIFSSVYANDSLFKKSLFFIILLFQSLVLILYGFSSNFLFIVGILAGAFFLVITTFSVEKTSYIFISYLSILPLQYHLHFFPSLPFGYSAKIGFFLFLLVLAYWLIDLTLKRIKVVFTLMDKALLVFFLSILLSAFWGIAKGNRLMPLIREFTVLAFYLGYFVFVYSSFKKENFNIFFDFILILTLVVSFEVLNAISFSQGFFLYRINTRQAHLAQLAIPYIGLTLVYSKSRLRRSLSFASLLPIVMMVIISQQRALWITSFLSLLFILTLALKRREYVFKSLSFVTIAIVITFLCSILILKRISGSFVLPSIFGRMYIFKNIGTILSDPTSTARIATFKNVLSSMGREILLGKGLGAFHMTRCLYYSPKYFVDNSYVQILWKMGFLGLISFLVMVSIFLKRAVFVFIHTQDNKEKIYSMTAFLNFVGLAVIAFTNSSLVCYRFIFIWAITFGVIEVLYREQIKKHKA